jgi:hypothetical protein
MKYIFVLSQTRSLNFLIEIYLDKLIKNVFSILFDKVYFNFYFVLFNKTLTYFSSTEEVFFIQSFMIFYS